MEIIKRDDVIYIPATAEQIQKEAHRLYENGDMTARDYLDILSAVKKTSSKRAWWQILLGQ